MGGGECDYRGVKGAIKDCSSTIMSCLYKGVWRYAPAGTSGLFLMASETWFSVMGRVISAGSPLLLIVKLM